LTDESAIGDRDKALMGTVIPHSLSLADDSQRRWSLKEVCDKVEAEEVLQDGRLDHPTSATVNKGEFEEVQHDNEKDYREFEGGAGLGLEESGNNATGSTVNTSDIWNISSTTTNYEESGDGSTRTAPDVTDVSDVRNVGKDCEKSDKGEEILYRQKRTAPAGNEWSSERQSPLVLPGDHLASETRN